MKDLDQSPNPWKIDEKDFPRHGTPAEQMKFLLRYTILAPSSHNTQPWKFKLAAPWSIEVHADLNGWLKVADPDQRELHLSLGCALENLLVTAAHFGFATRIDYLPDPDRPTHISTIGLSEAEGDTFNKHATLFRAITVRTTNHKIFDARSIDPTILHKIQRCCDEPDVQLHFTTDQEIRRQVDNLIVRSDAITFSNPAYREELAYWIGQGVFGTSWLISQLGRLAMGYLNLGRFVKRGDEEALMSAPVIALITAAGNDRVTQLRAGQVFQRAYLTAALYGIGIRPMSQIVEVPECKQELGQIGPWRDSVPLQPFLMGHIDLDQAHTPRKLLEEVLV